jgi:cobalt-zinc-cadmium efflux system outer membrane protein
MSTPEFHYEEARAHVLGRHTDVLTARNAQQKARYDLHTAQITPIPDVDVRVAVQKDFSMAPFGITHSVQVGVPIPIWDRNQGSIRQAQGALLRATEEEHRVRDDLSQRLADAFERYESNRYLVRRYQQVLQDLSLVYSRTVLRFATQPMAVDTSLASLDVVTNQGLYLTAVATYAGALRDQWQAMADISNLLQIDDVFKGMENLKPVPEHLPPLPCSHPCNPLPEKGHSPAPGWQNQPASLPAERLAR